MSFLVIRARSDRGVTRKIRETMAMLNLTRVNHATIVMDNPSYRGMLHKSKDYITWGEVDAKTIEKLIKERGRMSGDKPVTDSTVKEFSNFNGIKPIFRLHPPRGSKGWGGIKRAYTVGGALGFRGEAIGDLADRMI